MTSSKSILIVDDVPEILALFQRTIDGFHTKPMDLVTTARSRDAMEMLSQRSFDIVISDYRMPEFDGLDVLSAARERNPSGRRVLMTGYNEVPASAEALATASIDGRIQKPLARGAILELLQACVSDDPDALADYRSGPGG